MAPLLAICFCHSQGKFTELPRGQAPITTYTKPNMVKIMATCSRFCTVRALNPREQYKLSRVAPASKAGTLVIKNNGAMVLLGRIALTKNGGYVVVSVPQSDILQSLIITEAK